MRVLAILLMLGFSIISGGLRPIASSSEASASDGLLRLASFSGRTTDPGTQSPSRPEWVVLGDQSTVIVSGVIDQVSQVVRPEKMGATSTTLPSGEIQLALPDPLEYGVGRVVRIRIDDVIKTDRRVRKNSRVSIFLPGRVSREGQANLLAGKRYVVFLRPLEADRSEFAGTKIYQTDSQGSKYLPFNPKSTYGVVQGGNGAVLLTGNKSGVINEIKGAVWQR